MQHTLSPSTLQFLKQLERNNNREWFTENKNLYINAQTNVIKLVEVLVDRIGEWDNEVAKLDAKKTLFRIYRDTRFSKDPRPYKTNFGASLGIGKGSQKAGYYLHIEPGKSFIAGGLYQPDATLLKKIRQEMVYNPENFLNTIEQDAFRQNFRGLSVENKLKRVPTGFEKDHPMAEYLKLKHYIVSHPLSDDLLTSDQSVDYITKVYHTMAPLVNYLNSAIELEDYGNKWGYA